MNKMPFNLSSVRYSLEGLGHVGLVPGQHGQPLVEELPVEGPARALVLRAVLQRVERDHVDERAHHRAVVQRYRLCAHSSRITETGLFYSTRR